MELQNLRNLIIQVISRSKDPEITADMLIDALREEGVLNVGYGKPDINAVVSKFTEVFGTTKTTKMDRNAANRLVTKYGVKTILFAIDTLAANMDKPFCPIVNNITQLENKWASVMNFLRTNAVIEKPLDT